MNRPILLSRRALGGLLLCMLGGSVLAQAQQYGYQEYVYKDFTAQEVAILPQYCQDKYAKRNKPMWVSQFGKKNYESIHHFCNGLVYYSRASTEIGRTSSIQDGLNNFNYVLGAWPDSFPLRQQAQMYKDQLEMMKQFKIK